MRHSKKLAALALAAGLAITATAAYAYWSTNGSGSGEAQVLGAYVEGASKVTVVQLASPNDMVPGGGAQAISGKFTNTNPGGVWIDHIHAVVVGTHKAGSVATPNGEACDADDFSIASLAVTDHEVAAGGAQDGAWSGTIAMLDRPGVDQDACKNAVVELSYTVHGESDPAPAPAPAP